MHLWGEAISFGSGFFLLLALALALSFECVNGFHDTANAVATVIYTKTLRPTYAVVWSGLCNLVGVLTSSGLVAYAIIGLLPHDLVMSIGTGNQAGEYIGFAMIFSLLISAILWNIGTWYLGLPVSSTHTLVGAILGVGVAHAVVSGQHWSQGLNWEQIDKVVLALLISPLVGFGVSALLLLAAKVFFRNNEDVFRAPKGDEPPPMGIRSTLVLTCTGVSFAHGFSDGQKGMGLIMLILVGVLPGAFALKSPEDPSQFQKTLALAQKSSAIFQAQAQASPPARTGDNSASAAKPVETPPAATSAVAAQMKPELGTPSQKTLNDFIKTGKTTRETYHAFVDECAVIRQELGSVHAFQDLPQQQRDEVRKDIYLMDDSISKISKAKLIADKDQTKTLKDFQNSLEGYTKYIPIWVKVAVALALGFGTMIGWKRVVVTVGEKIGKAHLTYAQGASAELVTFVTVLGAGLQGWPVSTTHVLSSGIAGTMAANGSGLQKQTLINIVLAWVLTLPVCVFLGASLFSAALYVVFHVLGAHA